MTDETTEVTEETPEEAPVETTAAAEDVSEESSAAETSTDDGTGLTLGSGAPAGEEDEQPQYDPIIRGKVDRFGVAMGTGRRKTSVARVRIKEGTGVVTVNGRTMEDYFNVERDQKMIQAPLVATDELGKVDVWVRVNGGGITGQTGAVVLGVARALQAKNPANHGALAEGGFLTRDGRMVERKKFGLRKARRSFQFSKR